MFSNGMFDPFFYYMLTTIITATAFYLLGALFSYYMLKTEHVAEGNTYTVGNQVLGLLFSLFSWVTVLIILWIAWIGQIRKTGYFNKPVNPKNK